MTDDRSLWDRRQRAMQRHWELMDRVAAFGRAPTQSSIDVAREHIAPERPRIRVKATTSRTGD